MGNIIKSTLGIMIATVFCKVLGFGRDLVLASEYGASMYSDIFLTTLNIPQIIFATIGGALVTTFIPIYNESRNSKYGDESLKFTNNIINIALIVSTMLGIIGIIYTEELVKLFAMGFEGDALRISVTFTRILIFSIVFISITNIICSYLQVNNTFIVTSLIAIPYNIIIIVSILLSKNNIYILPIGTFFAFASQLIFVLYFAHKKKYKYNKYLNLKDEYIKKLSVLIMPVFIGVAVNQINTMIDRSLASTLVEGSISALNYASRLNTFVMAIFISSLSIVIYPNMSKLSNNENKEEFINIISSSIIGVIILIVPITIGAIVLSNPIVSILFKRGSFDDYATNMTSIALIFYSIGMIGFGLRDIMSKVFYSLNDTKTPMINGVLSMMLNIILNIILIKHMKHAGLALATSISSIFCIILLFRSLNKKIGYFQQDKIKATLIKTTVASIIMGYFTNMIYKLCIDYFIYSNIGEICSVFISVLSGMIIYLILISIMRVYDFKKVLSLIK